MPHWFYSFLVFLLFSWCSALAQSNPRVSALSWEAPFKDDRVIESTLRISEPMLALKVAILSGTPIDLAMIKVNVNGSDVDVVSDRSLQTLEVNSGTWHFAFTCRIAMQTLQTANVVVQVGDKASKALRLVYTPELVDDASEATIKNLRLFIDENSIGTGMLARMPALQWVKGGVFTMGSDADDVLANSKPAHSVIVSDFRISTHEITVEEFGLFMQDPESRTFLSTLAQEASGSNVFISNHWQLMNSVDWSCDIHGLKYDSIAGNHFPVVNVSWYEANAYCLWLSTRTGRRFRLPTEAEWEYAAKGGKYTADDQRYSGSNNINEVANFNSGRLTPVGRFLANRLTLWDMSGNVWEWCQDRYGAEYYSQQHFDNPTGPLEGSANSSTNMVVRGGSWAEEESACLTVKRIGSPPRQRAANIGFRIVEKINSL